MSYSKPRVHLELLFPKDLTIDSFLEIALVSHPRNSVPGHCSSEFLGRHSPPHFGVSCREARLPWQKISLCRIWSQEEEVLTHSHPYSRVVPALPRVKSRQECHLHLWGVCVCAYVHTCVCGGQRQLQI